MRQHPPETQTESLPATTTTYGSHRRRRLVVNNWQQQQHGQHCFLSSSAREQAGSQCSQAASQPAVCKVIVGNTCFFASALVARPRAEPVPVPEPESDLESESKSESRWHSPAATLAQTGCIFNAPSVVVFFPLATLFCCCCLLLLLTAALVPDAAQRGSYIDSLSAWHCFYERLQLPQFPSALPQFAATVAVVVLCNSLQSF